MAIDRAPWNALVDDDGSNLVGTVWNKDKIKTVILDPVDAALAANAGLPAGGANGDLLTRDLAVPTFGAKWAPLSDPTWVDIPYAAANFAALGGGTWTVSSHLTFIYRREGALLTVQFYLQATTIAGNVTTCRIKVPLGLLWRNYVVNTVMLSAGGVDAAVVAQSSPATNEIDIYRTLTSTPFPVGSCTIAGTAMVPIAL